LTDLHYSQIAKWREEIARVPEKRLYHRLAEALLKVGRPHDALDIATKGLFIHDTKYWACVEAKGAAEVALGRYPDAVLTLRPLTEQVANPENLRLLAMALYGVNQDEEAAKICKRILQGNPFDASAQKLMNKGRAALPEPIAQDVPLPESKDAPHVEPPVASVPEPQEEPDQELVEDAEPAAHAKPHLRIVENEHEDVDVFGEEEPAPIQAPEEVDVFGAEPDAAPIEESAAPEPAPVEEIGTPEPAPASEAPAETRADDSQVLHRVGAGDRPFDADAAPEAEAALDRLFSAMSDAPPAIADEETRFAAPEQADDAQAAIPQEELGHEYDPTEGMDAHIEVEETNVFGEIGGEPSERETPESSPLPPSPASENVADADRKTTDAPKKKGFFRRVFGSRRKRKENR